MTPTLTDTEPVSTREQASQLAPARVPARWVGGAAGAALTLYGLSRRTPLGYGLAVGGGVLLWRALFAKPRTAPAPFEVSKVLTVNAPLETLWSMWAMDRLPLYLRHVDAVTPERGLVSGATDVRLQPGERAEWIVRLPGFPVMTWHTEVLESRAPHRLVWRTVGDAMLAHLGTVEMRLAPGGRGTEVRVRLRFRTPGPVTRTALQIFEKIPKLGFLDDLMHFRQLAETGEIATTRGQPSGRSPGAREVAP